MARKARLQIISNTNTVRPVLRGAFGCAATGIGIATRILWISKKGELMHGEIQRDEWRTYLDGFTRRNSGRTAYVEMLGMDLGAQEAVDKLPLEGIIFKDKDSSVEI